MLKNIYPLFNKIQNVANKNDQNKIPPCPAFCKWHIFLQTVCLIPIVYNAPKLPLPTPSNTQSNQTIQKQYPKNDFKYYHTCIISNQKKQKHRSHFV